MIQVRCASCRDEFSVGDEFAGQTEQCPTCGALNDVEEPILESSAIAIFDPGQTLFNPTQTLLLEAPPRQHARHHIETKRGVPVALWWAAIFAAITVFVIGILNISGDDWESKNLLSLVGLSVTGDHMMAAGDFEGASGKYQAILDDVGPRHLESEYLVQLVKTVRTRLTTANTDAAIATQVKNADAMATAHKWEAAADDYKDVLNSAPKNVDPSDPIAPLLARAQKGLDLAQNPDVIHADDATATLDPTVSPDTALKAASTQSDPDSETITAIKRFQRDSEGLAQFVSNKSFLFLDAQGSWRQRQYVLWDVHTSHASSKDPALPHLKLTYTAVSRTTGPHKGPDEATADLDFNVDEKNDFIDHESAFSLVKGKWVADQRRRGDAQGENWADARSPQFTVKRSDGSIERYQEQELWQMEDQVLGQ